MSWEQRAILPWTIIPEEERRFRRILKSIFITILLFSVVIPFLPVPPKLHEQEAEVPSRFARLITQEKPPPPPPPPVVVEQPTPEPTPEAVPEPEPESEPKVEEAPEAPVAQPEPKVAARERAARSGLLALSNELADLRVDAIVNKLETQPLRAGAAATPTPEPERVIITSQVASGSGGINTRKLSRETGGTQLASRTTTQVAAPPVVGAPEPVRSPTAAAPTPRSSEEIQMMFDRNKGTLNALYNRALRTNPSLAGKVILRLTIDATGAVIDCEIVSSELKDPDLERKIIARVKLFNFGAKKAAVTTITYPIDFFPG